VWQQLVAGESHLRRFHEHQHGQREPAVVDRRDLDWGDRGAEGGRHAERSRRSA
jgi:hypothetical protein